MRTDGAQEGDEVTAVFSTGSTAEATFDEGVWQFDIAPETDWPAGPVTVSMRDTSNLDDAAFKSRQSFSDAGAGHVDNYSDSSREDGAWRFDFDCLGFGVTSMA